MSEYFIAKLGYLIACILVFYIILSHIDGTDTGNERRIT